MCFVFIYYCFFLFVLCFFFFFFKQKTAYEIYQCDWSSDVCSSDLRFGFRVPILIKANGDIIDGHLRYKSALSLDLLEIPCLVADDMTDSEIKAFRISVNKLAELAEWDDDLLHQELLNISDEDIELIGFDKKIIKQNNKAELKKLICKPPEDRKSVV